jgi:tetratricopeptide (TPR) repeat protein
MEAAVAYYVKGKDYETQNHSVEAAEQYRLAMTVNPQYDEAAEALDRVEKHLQSQSEAYYQAAMGYEKKGLRKKARQHYLTGLRLWPENRKIIEKLIQQPGSKEITGPYVIHTVQPGESFSLIAKAYYGDLHKYQVIMDFNDIIDPTALKVGQKIKVPGADIAVAAVSDADVASRVRTEDVHEPEKEAKTAKEAEKSEIAKIAEDDEETEPEVDQAANYKELGMEMYNQKSYLEAALEFEKVLNTNPDDAAAIDYVFKSYFEQAKISLQNQEYLVARNQFESALRHQPACGQCYRYIERSENLYKEDHYKRGMYHYGKQELEQAITEWQLVSDIDAEFKNVNSMIQKAETMLQNLNKMKKQ